MSKSSIDDFDEPHTVWHFENIQFAVAYCREIGIWWTGNSINLDARGQDITQNPKFVTCLKCLRKMKENGMPNPFSKRELAILKKVKENNHILLPKDKKDQIVCYRLAASGHLSEHLGFKDETLFYETDIGNTALGAVTEVYESEEK